MLPFVAEWRLAKRFWLCLLAVFALIPDCAVASEPIKIRVTVQFPVTEPFVGATVARFKAAVEKASNNAVTVEIFDAGRLYIDDQALGAVRSGAIEMALSAINQVSRLLPAASLLEQPFVFNFQNLLGAAAGPESEMRQLIDAAILEKFGLRALWWQTIGHQVIYARDGDVRDPGRLNNKKIRTFSEVTRDTASSCGGKAQIASASVVHKGIREGTFDMAMMTAAGGQSYKMWEVASTITRTNHAAVAFLAVISEKTWQSLDDKHRFFLLQAAKEVEQIARQREAELEAAAYDQFRNKGVKILDLSPDDVMQWRACSAQVISEYMDKSSEFGRLLMDAYGRLRTQPCCSGGPHHPK